MTRSRQPAAQRVIAGGVALAALAGALYLARGGIPGLAAGPAWRPAGLPGQTVHSLAAGHSHPSLLFAGTQTGVYRRGGERWRRELSSTAVWALDLLPNDSGLIAGTDDGYVYVSTDRGRHWIHRSVSRQGVYAVTADPSDGRRIIAGAGGGLYLSRDAGRHWVRTLRLRQSAGTALAWLPGNPQILVAGTVPAGPAGERRVFMSEDAGLTWRSFGRGMAANGGIMSLAFARDRLFAGTMGHAVWTARLDSRRWRRAGNGMPAIDDHGAALLAAGRDTVVVGTLGQGVYQSRNAGRQWANVSTGLPRTDGLAVVLSLANTNGTDVLYAGTLNGVYRLSVE